MHYKFLPNPLPFSRSVLFVLILLGCRESFVPDAEFRQTNFLVVEGFISVGPDAVTTITLSRTIPLSDPSASPIIESGAVLAIEDDQENSYTLSEISPGVYRSDTISLPTDRNYRISILTTDNSSYTSDFVTPIITPAIDSVSWKPYMEGNVFGGIEIYAFTHDFSNQTQYYQWTYDEAWERRMQYASTQKYENGILVSRDNEEIRKMYTCYERASEPDLITESAVNLKNHVIQKKLLRIPLKDIRIQRKYSITVTQVAPSVEDYTYLQIMRKNTSSLGGFFDPQPSQLNGNIQKAGSGEPVIGFMEAYQSSQLVLPIRASDIPWWQYQYSCNIIQVALHPDSLRKYFGDGENLPLLFDTTPPTPLFITATDKTCADCRTLGGNNIKPDFWDALFGDD